MRLDETIKKDVVGQLYWDSRVDASEINVTVDEGTVTLSGSVPTFLAREAATSDARLVHGVTWVDNQLRIVYPQPQTLPSDNLEFIHSGSVTDGFYQTRQN
jgi:osmotically-inducible protein OsmY